MLTIVNIAPMLTIVNMPVVWTTVNIHRLVPRGRNQFTPEPRSFRATNQFTRPARGRSARPLAVLPILPAILQRLALQTPGRLGRCLCVRACACAASTRRARDEHETSMRRARPATHACRLSFAGSSGRAGGAVRSGAVAVLPGSFGNTASGPRRTVPLRAPGPAHARRATWLDSGSPRERRLWASATGVSISPKCGC